MHAVNTWTRFFTCIVIICFNHTLALAQNNAAKEVLQRLVPLAASKFNFEQIPTENGKDIFEVEASGGMVTIRGSTPVAMCRGAYDYLRNNCKCMVTWDGDQLNLPNPLPAAATRRVVCPAKFRHYFNTTTFGYSTVYWDWKRWEREIDWMALHGVNMPLAMNGQEKIWQTVFKSMGFTDPDLLNGFFNGPAFLPWQRMGNMYAYNASIPQSFIDADAQLQKKILARELELGMIPVPPGFSGFVPNAFKDKYPSAIVVRLSGWGGVSYQLDARDPMFSEISSKFITEYNKEFGNVSHYYTDILV